MNFHHLALDRVDSVLLLHFLLDLHAALAICSVRSMGGSVLLKWAAAVRHLSSTHSISPLLSFLANDPDISTHE